MNGEKKKAMLRSRAKVQVDVITDVVDPAVLHPRVPRIESVAEARVEHRNLVNTMRELGKYRDAHMNYVANIDSSIWSAVVSCFARHDPETGELMDDGLLYRWSPEKGCLVLNKDFFYALLDGPLKQFDMRGKNKVII